MSVVFTELVAEVKCLRLNVSADIFGTTVTLTLDLLTPKSNAFGPSVVKVWSNSVNKYSLE